MDDDDDVMVMLLVLLPILEEDVCSRVPPTCGIALQMFTDGMVELETTVNFNLMNSTASVD